MKLKTTIVAVWLLSSVFSISVAADEYEGSVRAGYVFTDLEGNQAVHQPTFNLYDGATFSLEKFRYQRADGIRLTANIYSAFLNNRRVNLGLSKSGLGGINFNHSAYRRTYDFNGDDFTRRRVSSGSAWLRPVKQVKLFGGIDYTDKQGKMVDLIEPELGTGLNQTDYTRQGFHAGMEVKHRRSYGRVEFRQADFNDDLNTTNDRKSQRARLTFFSPLPRFEQFVLSGGLQHFENRMENRSDTLCANTAWGAVQYSHKFGYHVRYSFMFDRARRTGDLTDTDNILHTVHVGKVWPGRGGITAGYGNGVNDDAGIERSIDSYSLTGWVKPIDALLIRAGMDMQDNVVDSGRTLTGDHDRNRHYLAARYTIYDASLQVKLEDRQRTNDEIGSNLDFLRISSDLAVSTSEYGMLTASYGYGNGNYENAAGKFRYTEHTVSGEAWSPEYRRAQAGARGTYYRARRNVDIESFTVEFTGRYGVFDKTRLEVIYSAHNYDDYNDPAEFYDQYFTANVVTATLVYEL